MSAVKKPRINDITQPPKPERQSRFTLIRGVNGVAQSLDRRSLFGDNALMIWTVVIVAFVTAVSVYAAVPPELTPDSKFQEALREAPSAARPVCENYANSMKTVKVTKIVNGASFKIAHGDKEVKIQLAETDAPAVEQKHFDECVSVLEKLLANKTVRIYPISILKYGIARAYVCASGQDVSEAVLVLG